MSTPKPVNLPLAKVIEAGRKAYLEKRLSAQGPTPACAYRDASGRPCIIGAAMTDAQALRLDGAVAYLESRGRIRTDNLQRLCYLQSAHDFWASSPTPADAAIHEAELCELLGLPSPNGEG